jgi:hypothetical protein
MKYIFLLAVSTALFLGTYSCSKDKAAAPAIGAACDSTKVGYSKAGKILSDNCATSGCHDATRKQSGLDLSVYTDCRTLIEGRNGLCNIKDNGCSLMPPSGKMADSLITVIEQWKADGYCSN